MKKTAHDLLDDMRFSTVKLTVENNEGEESVGTGFFFDPELGEETYTCETVFVTVNIPAYVYSHAEEERPIRVIPALDIMDNPMVVFEE